MTARLYSRGLKDVLERLPTATNQTTTQLTPLAWKNGRRPPAAWEQSRECGMAASLPLTVEGGDDGLLYRNRRKMKKGNGKILQN